ncbi:hypothetical protein QYF61_027082 [Mycteria americana]|uniref:Uncharacterized protein n=1 Tax=Mycteria americana TaxID=33587 RepID=A0AAN7PAC8_MYCAM|nr:hypothetical protein QYF61_027082 [Mycteria americana]
MSLLTAGEVFHLSDHFCGPPLDLLQQVHVFPVLRAPELDAVLQVGSHQNRAEGQNHLPRPAGRASFDAAQDTVGLLGCECPLPAHVQLFIHQYSQALLHRAALNPFIPQPVLILGVALTQVQDLALGLVEPHEVQTGPHLELVQVPLDSIPSLRTPLVLLEAISSCPMACYLGEETNMHLATTSFQAKQPQFPQPLLTRLVLQTLCQLHCPSLDTLQHLNVSLVVRGPKLNTVFKVRPHQCQAQGDNHFPSPAGHTISDTSQDAVGLLGHLGTLLAHIQLAIDQHPQVLFCQAAFQPLFPKPVALQGVIVTQVQDAALSLVECHTIGLSPLIQPVQVPL